MEKLIHPTLYESILRYYVEAGLDYRYWSKHFNMHFGFSSIGDVLNREKMLSRMSDEVLRRLRITGANQRVADFGCGLGATMRQAALQFDSLNLTGVTVVPWQKTSGDQLTIDAGLADRVEIKTEDYHCTTLPSNSFDGVYCIESACYSPEHLHTVFFTEIYRVLKKGGRVAIADGFLKRSSDSLNPFIRKTLGGICRNWSLPGMMNVHQTKSIMQKVGFKDILFEEVSWRVAPSVLHVPFVIVWFLLHKTFRNEKLSVQSIRNLKGSFQTLLLGLDRKNFGYYLVSAEK